MTTCLFLISALLHLSNNSHSFEQYFIKGQPSKNGVQFQFAYHDLKDFDLLVLEKYDTSHKIYVKLKDFTAKEILQHKGDTFVYFVAGALGKRHLADCYQFKLVTKSHLIKIYNDADAGGIYFTNTDKRMFAKSNVKDDLLNLSKMQKQALKSELKLQEKGYSFINETVYYEIEYSKEIEQYFVTAYNQYLEEEKSLLLFDEQRSLITEMIRSSMAIKKTQEDKLTETTWEELDASFIAFFDTIEKRLLAD